jgi:multidrug efflux pump subunit AcrA (membrane-fusion protein)
VTLVPAAALTVEGDQTYAFVVAGNTVDRRAVRTGGADGDRVEVVAGLRAGDRVVVSPPPTLASGMAVMEKRQ